MIRSSSRRERTRSPRPHPKASAGRRLSGGLSRNPFPMRSTSSRSPRGSGTLSSEVRCRNPRPLARTAVSVGTEGSSRDSGTALEWARRRQRRDTCGFHVPMLREAMARPPGAPRGATRRNRAGGVDGVQPTRPPGRSPRYRRASSDAVPRAFRAHRPETSSLARNPAFAPRPEDPAYQSCRRASRSQEARGSRCWSLPSVSAPRQRPSQGHVRPQSSRNHTRDLDTEAFRVPHCRHGTGPARIIGPRRQ